MTVEPEPADPEDPAGILRLLPAEHRGQFLDEYLEALGAALMPEKFRALGEMLHLWRLRAVAYSSPGRADRLAAAMSELPSAPA
jgi:hypothetical protein